MFCEKQSFLSLFTEPIIRRAVPTPDPIVNLLIETSTVSPIIETIVDPIIETTVDSIVETTVGSIFEKIVDPIIETTTLNPIIETIVEPIIDKIVEPIYETTVEPIIESIIDPIVTSQEVLKSMYFEGMDVTNMSFMSDIIPEEIQMFLKSYQISPQILIVVFIIAFNWCLMKLLLPIFNSSKKETELRKKCCNAERQIYYFEAEKQKLRTEIDRQQEMVRNAEERMQTAEHKVIPLEKEFTKLKNERDQLLQKVITLENELETTAEAGLEANRLLNDFLTSQKENVNLNSSVEALQQQITKQTEIVTKYESTAKQKEKENHELKEKSEKMSAELERMKKHLKETERNLEIFQSNNEELKASKNELNSSLCDLEEKYSNLEKCSENYIQTNEKLLINVQKLTEEVKQLNEEMVSKDKEIESWKQMARLSKSRKLEVNSDEELNEEENDEIDSEKSLTDLYDIVKMDVRLKNLMNDKNELTSKLEDISEECKQLNHKIKALEENNKLLKTERESAVNDKIKAENKLEVLTDHYRAKELEFGKEIGVQQIQRQQKEEDVDSLANQLISLKDENTSLRSQLSSMKKEIEDTERKYKSNINQLEKQVHENWILARNAERKLDEAKAEATVLRQTLTMSVKSPIDGFSGDASYLDDSASSISDHFNGPMPPPPPLPPMLPPPPPSSLFNPLMLPMHMPFTEESDATALWNQNFHQNMNLMNSIPPFPSMQSFNSNQSDVSINSNLSFTNSQPMSYTQNVPQMQPTGQHWNTTVTTRDTYSPHNSQHNMSNSSSHSQYMYSQPNHYPHSMTPISSPITDSSINEQQLQNPISSNNSIINSNPIMRSNMPLESTNHWTQSKGNISNLDNIHNPYNESESSLRPNSRNERNGDSLHTSMV